jgi:membrane protein DedA with SNARE-associated domain
VFSLEDTTVVIVGVLAADGFFPVPFALFALYTGIIVGDLGLYCIGRLASTHPRLAHYVDHDFVAPFRAWLETRFVLTVFSARFIPGARMPTYTASGFFRSPLSKFILTSICATSIWTTFLFSVSYWFGSATSGWMVPARWGIALLFLITLFFIGRHNLRTYRAKRDEMSVTNDRQAP